MSFILDVFWGILKNILIRAAETGQRLKALTALPEVLGSLPSTHMSPYNCL